MDITIDANVLYPSEKGWLVLGEIVMKKIDRVMLTLLLLALVGAPSLTWSAVTVADQPTDAEVIARLTAGNL